jgi:hypothetical protein
MIFCQNVSRREIMKKMLFLVVLGFVLISALVFAQQIVLRAGTYNRVAASNPESISIVPSQYTATAYDSSGRRILSGKSSIRGDTLTITWNKVHVDGYDLGTWTYTIIDPSNFRANQWPNETYTWVGRPK